MRGNSLYKKFKRLGDTFGGFIIEKINGGSIFILNEDYNTKTISFKVNSNLGNLIRWFDNGKELFDFNGIFQPSIKFDKGDHIVQAVITSSNEESKISDPIRIVIYGSSTQRQKMQLLFVPVNWDNNESFEQAANITKDLFLGTLSCGNDIPVKIFEDSELNCKFDPDQPGADQKVILCLQNNGYSIKAEDKVIGLMPKSAYSLKATYLGNGGQYPINSIILYFDIKEKYPTMRDGIVALHEMGHVYGLCDEYSLSAWFAQKVGSKSTGFLDGCPLNNYPKICGVTDKIGELNRSWRDIKSPIKGETPDYLKNDYLYFEPSDLLLPPWNPICNQNGICEEDDKNLGRFTSENYLNCPSDCNEINPSDDCGNNFCVFPETKSNCPQDCDQKDCVGEITDEGDLVWFSIMGDIGNDNYSFETENGTKTYLARYPNKFQVLFDGLICGSQ